MKIIKLDATDSTNAFLKRSCKLHDVDNFTVVVAQNQTEGKGQRDSKWETERGKNLTFSILIKNGLTNINQVFNLNVMVAVSILEVLKVNEIIDLAIKWPNDIMSGNKKIGGILIENSIKANQKIESVVGIGINVNQTQFFNLPHVSSLSAVSQKQFNLEALLVQLCKQIELNFERMTFEQLYFWNNYHTNLFKKNVVAAFEDVNQNRFMGIIQRVSEQGKLVVLVDDNLEKMFSIKEIKLLL